MGKRRLLRGIVTGAVIGGIISLFNNDARHYAKEKMCATKEATTNLIKQPTETVSSMKQTVETLSHRFSEESNNVLNALEQIESTLGKVTKRSDT